MIETNYTASKLPRTGDTVTVLRQDLPHLRGRTGKILSMRIKPLGMFSITEYTVKVYAKGLCTLLKRDIYKISL